MKFMIPFWTKQTTIRVWAVIEMFEDRKCNLWMILIKNKIPMHIVWIHVINGIYVLALLQGIMSNGTES